MTKLAQKKLEERVFEMFRKVYALPDGEPTYPENPDVIWVGKSKIGIEITNFYITAGQNLESEQQQRSLREKVVSEAQKKYSAAGRKKIELTVSFNENHPIKNANETIEKLSKLANKTDKQITGDVRKSEFSDIPELFSIYIYSEDCETPVWRSVQVHSSEYMSADRLQEIISDKDRKVEQYQTCDEYWLLVVVNYFDPAQDREIRREDIENVESTKFKKVILYRPPHEEIVVIDY
jgi:hypothetical protein